MQTSTVLAFPGVANPAKCHWIAYLLTLRLAQLQEDAEVGFHIKDIPVSSTRETQEKRLALLARKTEQARDAQIAQLSTEPKRSAPIREVQLALLTQQTIKSPLLDAADIAAILGIVNNAMTSTASVAQEAALSILKKVDKMRTEGPFSSYFPA